MEDEMSEQTNLQIVQAAYAAFGRGDIPAVLGVMAPDITMGIVGRIKDAPFFGIRSGIEGAAEFFRDLDAAHEINTFEPQRFVAAGDLVLIWGKYRWTMRRSGMSDETEWFHVIDLRDGKMVKWRGHNDTAMLAEAYHAAPKSKLAVTR
jgi:ketosteroid isomerase-like protein